MTNDRRHSIRIAPDDLRVVAQALLLRLPLRAPESRRLAYMNTLLAASTELGRSVTTHTHCGRVNCQGSHGIGDLLADTEALQSALATWASLVQEIANEYRGVVDGMGPQALLSDTTTLSFPVAS